MSDEHNIADLMDAMGERHTRECLRNCINRLDRTLMWIDRRLESLESKWNR